MTVYVALLRAVNVGGTGTLPMAELKAICEGIGLADVKTYIQSGNVVFRSDESRDAVLVMLERALAERMGRAAGVVLRTAAELAGIVRACPFPHAKANHILVTFLGEAAATDALEGLSAPDGEEVAISGHEIYIHYPLGSGRSKLKLPALKAGTARNLNTVEKLAGMAAALEDGG